MAEAFQGHHLQPRTTAETQPKSNHNHHHDQNPAKIKSQQRPKSPPIKSQNHEPHPPKSQTTKSQNHNKDPKSQIKESQNHNKDPKSQNQKSNPTHRNQPTPRATPSLNHHDQPTPSSQSHLDQPTNLATEIKNLPKSIKTTEIKTHRYQITKPIAETHDPRKTTTAQPHPASHLGHT